MPAYRAMPATGRQLSRSCSSCRRSSACTSTSRTSAAASPRTATSRSRPSSTRGRAIRRRTPTSPKLISEIVAKVPDAQVMGDLDASVACAKATRQGRDRAPRHHRLLLGRPHRLHVRRAQSRREGGGRLVRHDRQARSRPGDKTPLDVAAQIKSAGARPLRRRRRRAFRRDTVEKMFAALKASGNTKSEFTIYPDTPHGFNADYRPSYRKEQARGRVEQDARVVQAQSVAP